MNKRFLNVIGFFSIACLSINACGHLPEVKANNYEGTKKDQSAKKINGAKPVKRLVLVPPPPPDQPALLDLSPIGGMGELASFLNEGELRTKLLHLQSQINDAKLKVKDSNDLLVGSKEKIDQFNSLYAEGVVSRKELDTVKKESVDQEHLAEEAKNDLADLEIEQTALIRRLNILEHNSKRHQVPSNRHRKG